MYLPNVRPLKSAMMTVERSFAMQCLKKCASSLNKIWTDEAKFTRDGLVDFSEF